MKTGVTKEQLVKSLADNYGTAIMRDILRVVD